MNKKLLVVCIISLLSATATYAYTGPKSDGDYKVVINDFIDSHVNSDYKKLKNIMDDNSSLNIPRGNKVIKQDKSSLVESLRNNSGTKQNCESDYQVLAKSDALVIARVDFSYHDTIQHNYLIVEKDDNEQWKIAQVYKMFDDIEAPVNNERVTAKKEFKN
ncbi:MAG: hypothetical protein AAGC65_03815 [Mucilaginibacter sp.]|uniref:hypothetical protein n=1 Tax=Mucilaginibacter sp. TaxID=1882438 RepID=UPI0031AFC1DD